jgi:hypothetical protein
MIGSIERLRRHIQVRNLAPMMLLVIGVPARPDPIAKRAGGTSGVLPIPGPTVAAPSTSGAHVDPTAELRRDTRADRGRVLYSTGQARRDTTAVRTLHKPCAEQRVVQGRNPAPSPNS